jgi:hypothetical protein
MPQESGREMGITKQERQEFRARTALCLAIRDLVAAMMGWKKDKAQWWMITVNPNFGGTSPAMLVQTGRSHKVLSFIESAMEEARP